MMTSTSANLFTLPVMKLREEGGIVAWIYAVFGVGQVVRYIDS